MNVLALATWNWVLIVIAVVLLAFAIWKKRQG